MIWKSTCVTAKSTHHSSSGQVLECDDVYNNDKERHMFSTENNVEFERINGNCSLYVDSRCNRTGCKRDPWLFVGIPAFPHRLLLAIILSKINLPLLGQPSRFPSPSKTSPHHYKVISGFYWGIFSRGITHQERINSIKIAAQSSIYMLLHQKAPWLKCTGILLNYFTSLASLTIKF